MALHLFVCVCVCVVLFVLFLFVYVCIVCLFGLILYCLSVCLRDIVCVCLCLYCLIGWINFVLCGFIFILFLFLFLFLLLFLFFCINFIFVMCEMIEQFSYTCLFVYLFVCLHVFVLEPRPAFNFLPTYKKKEDREVPTDYKQPNW